MTKTVVSLEDNLFAESETLFEKDKTKLKSKRSINKDKSQDHIETAHIIRKYIKLITMEDNDEIFYYDRNIWKNDGKTAIREMCHDLNEKFSIHEINEIIDKIRRMSYKKREILNPSHLIGFENVVLDLNNWEMIPHCESHYLTKTIPISYDPGIYPEKFVKFFEKVVQEKDQQLVLEMMAHCLMNDYRFQKSFVILGSGDNGKTTFLNILIAFLGEENICSLTLENFQNNQFAASKLFGKMANIADDISKKGLKETQTFKILTGNGFGDYNIKGKQSITFRNAAKLIFSCNELPPIYENTHAIWRRLCLINFSVKIPEENQIKDLDKRLTTKDELSGILNLLLFSLRRLIDRGEFEGLKSVLDVKSQWIRKSDLVHAFCDNCIEYEQFNWISTEELFREMCLYAEAIHQEPRSKRTLSDRLLMFRPRAYREFGTYNDKKARGFKGINIIDWRQRIEK